MKWFLLLIEKIVDLFSNRGRSEGGNVDRDSAEESPEEKQLENIPKDNYPMF